ncbi:ThiF family adenylyltransferase [Mesorhizobium sp. VK9D]|uniref:ThiF family adenylyltransferase n=1 Tax=Mesorhizobium australafricanum TaxID=3072311 RepID=UPI002A2499CC|nr:ThiF family adenylyltransferase [Mesorhizobium sp. VK9D]MDX8456779.1 ThiF family adenylyltransferase [Mesorhizobium sp. VK9D]
MTHYSLRMIEDHRRQLRELLLADEDEAAALALCGRSRVHNPWTGEVDERFVVREVVAVPPEAYHERRPDGFTWSTAPFYSLLKRAESRDLAVAVFHSHPRGVLEFSMHDDVSDQALFSLAFNRLESRRPHLSVIMDRDGSFVGRVFGPELRPEIFSDVVVIGERWDFGAAAADSNTPELDRQRRAFGAETSGQLAKLKIGIVGLGGTGSAVAALVSRIGVRHLALIDPDRVEDTNLGRLHFATRFDANLRRLKVDVVGEGIAELGLPTNIVRLPHFDSHPEALAALRACDVVFGCTDDHLGREVLNRLAHFYYVPVIDLGLLIEPNDQGGYDTFDGRVTVVQPGYPCQTCRGLIKDEQMFLDSLRRDGELLVARQRAGYVPNNPDPNPVVVTFTTEVAAMAVNELFYRLNGFRGPDEHASERVRSFRYLKDSDTLPQGKSKPECKICGRRHYDGRGDMSPLLDLVL